MDIKKRKDGMKIILKPRPILAEELTQQPVLERAFIGILKEKKDISKAITALAKCLPNPQHLKRCSGLKIYLAPCQKFQSEPEDLKIFLVQQEVDLSLFENKFEEAEVPATAPRTKAQMTYASTFWPLNFHPDLRLEALISGSIFNGDQLASLEYCMRLVIAAAEDTGIGSKDCNGSALIVDPEKCKIMAVAVSRVDKHPMWHAAMIAVDLVAKIQGGGAWKLLDEETVEGGKRKHPKDLPLRYPNCLSRLMISEDSNLIFIRKDQKERDTVNIDTASSDGKYGPYLCTGYWAFLLQEPCALCAMSLLHSRVSRIFYGAANPRTGILGSKAILHSVPGLNHRYQVWGSILEDECQKILETCRTIDY